MIAADDALPPNVARSVLAWKFPKPDLDRVRKLQNKNNTATLSDAERRELETYVRVGQFVAVMQAKARLTLKKRLRKVQGIATPSRRGRSAISCAGCTQGRRGDATTTQR